MAEPRECALCADGGGPCDVHAVDNQIRKFLSDLVDPEGFGYAVTSEVRREALYLLSLLK